MRKYEILYDCPIAEISRLADSDVAADFAATLVDPALSSFTTLTEQMRGLGADLARAKADRNHFSGWGDLRQCLESFERQFATFPEPRFGKFRLFVVLAEKLAQTAAPLDATVIDENQFEIRELPNSLPLSWFSRENGQSFEDSVAVFSCADIGAIERQIANCNISPHFVFHILASLAPILNVPAGHAALVKKNTPTIEAAAVDAFVRLVILASGKSVHSPQRYSSPLSVINPDIIHAGHLYHQWNEVLYVLSEYNSRDEILLKYLTIYHVVENLMFKFPIVELERQQGGRMFSIRDFRRLYQQVDEAETTALKRLFTAALKEEATPGITFESHLVTRWQSLVTPASLVDFESALGLLGIKKDRRPLRHSEFRVGSECAGLFTQMVYQTRCAIVHNKETEFHLTYASLNAAFITLLENFLMPSLEEICFALVGSPNQQVWYSRKELLLYQ
jgi:hypothetical protein